MAGIFQRRNAVSLVMFAAALLLNLSFRSLFFNFDGVACAIAVELSDFAHLVHGNHLAYGLVGWGFDQLLRALGYAGRAILSLQILNSILGAAGVGVFASLLLVMGRSERESALGAAALAVSQAWWFWSLEAQVYMLGAVCLLMAAREALAENPRFAHVGFWHAAAILGHVGHVMAAPAILWSFWSINRERRKKGIARYFLAASAALLVCYAAAGLLAVRVNSFETLRHWLLGSAALGVDRSFAWHGHPWHEAIPNWLAMTFKIFCGGPALPTAQRLAGAALAALPVAAALRALARKERFSIFWGYYLAGYAALYLTWEPQTMVYRITDLPALCVLALLGLSNIPNRVRLSLIALWVAAAGAFNYAYVIRPAANAANNIELVEALAIAEMTPPESWIMAEHGLAPVYTPYFGQRRCLNLRYFANEDSLTARLDQLNSTKQTILITARALEDQVLKSRLQRYGLRPFAAREGFSLYRVSR